MEVCAAQIEDVIMRKRGGYVIVRSGKRNKQREVSLNSTACCALEEHIRLSGISQSYFFPLLTQGNAYKKERSAIFFRSILDLQS